MKIGRRELVIIAAVIIVIIVVAAVAFMPSVVVTEKRLLRWSEANVPELDPAIGSDYSGSVSYVNLYDTLVYPAVNGTSLPHLATNWTVTPDGLNWTFNLRSGVKFHDLTELEAEDVVFSMERIITVGRGYSYLFKGWINQSIAVGNYTVKLVLNQVYGPFLTVLSRLYILNKDLVMEHLQPGLINFGTYFDYGTGWLLSHDAGSGPYKVKDFRKEEYVVFEKFKDYWGTFKPNAPDELKLYGMTVPTTIRTMISNRELEITDQWQTVENLDAMDAIEGVSIAEFPAGSVFFYMIHTRKPPTDDIHFRRAMAYAMNYTAVVTTLFPGCPIAQGPIPSILPGFDPTVPRYDMNLTKAQQELALSKYSANYTEYTIDVHWCAEVPDEERVALLFAQNMDAVGIEVRVTRTPWLTMIDEMAHMEAAPHIETIFVAPHYAEAGSMLESRYHSKSTTTWEQNEWLLNDTIDSMIEAAISTVNQTERFQKYSQIQHQIVEMCPSIFMFEQLEKHAYQSYYIDWYAANGIQYVNSVMGYNLDFKNIEVDIAKKKELT